MLGLKKGNVGNHYNMEIRFLGFIRILEIIPARVIMYITRKNQEVGSNNSVSGLNMNNNGPQ